MDQSAESANSQNAKWPLALSHNRLQTGGWARQQNSKFYSQAAPYAPADIAVAADVMPIATCELALITFARTGDLTQAR